MKKFLCIMALLLSSLQIMRAKDTQFQALLSYVQNVYQFGQICQQEKVYLHFDNTAYYQGDIIWFSAYVVNAATQTPAQSKVLYVELLSPNGVVLKQLKLKVENGQAHGSLPLVETPTDEARALRGVMALPSGFYEVRAYTRTMLNFDDMGVFSRVFPVYEAPEQEGDYSNPVMRRWNNPYDVQRPETEKIKNLSVTFYPEGGALVLGIANRVAFKAMDENGMGVAIRGHVRLDDEQSIAVETTHDGMGYFDFVPTKKRNTVEVEYDGKEHRFRLPDAEGEGYALRVDNSRAQQIKGRLTGHQGCKDELLGVMLICRGAVSYFDTISIQQGEAMFVIPKEELPTGVHQLHLFNARGDMLAQRHLFVNNNIDVGKVRVTASSAQYAPFEQVKLNVTTSAPDDTPMPATISVAVRDKQSMGASFNGNVMTNMLLSSDLKGYIHHPEYYFEGNDNARMQALDLLMMVQGWTRYNWRKMARVEPVYIQHYVEDGLVIDGYVLGRMKDKPIEGATVSMRLYSPDRTKTQECTVVTDKNGSFGFSVEEFDGKWDMFLSVLKDGKEVDCRMRLDRASRPAIRAYSAAETYVSNGATISDVVEDEKLLQEEFAMQANPDSTFLLDNVDVYGRKKYVDYLTFKAYDAEEDTELHLDRGNYTYMVRDYLLDKGYNIDHTRYTGVIPETITTRDEMMTWSLDQCPINNRRVLWYLHNEDSKWMKQSYTPGFEIDMEDVKSIIVYDSPFDYLSIPIVREVLTVEQIQELDMTKDLGDVVLGRGLYVIDIAMYPKGLRRSKAKGQRQTTFRGYSEVLAFYAPEYPDGPIQGDVDYRRTLYWNPTLTTGDDGNATVMFYNNGYSRQFDISAEGITSDGIILHTDNTN